MNACVAWMLYCTLCPSSALLLLLRWVVSAAKKEGVDEDLSKYDGEAFRIYVHGVHSVYFVSG